MWEPFGGLASAAVAAVALDRRAYVAELDKEFAQLALERLRFAVRSVDADLEEAASVAATNGDERLKRDPALGAPSRFVSLYV